MGDSSAQSRPKGYAPTSTVGRSRAKIIQAEPQNDYWQDDFVTLAYGDALDFYSMWASPKVIVSDGGYGVLGFEGDTTDHLNLPEWYEPHIIEWAKVATPQTTLWFWNSEIGWAAVHPVLERHGWRYVNANIWNKGKGHIAGNVNTKKIRRFPVVTEVCVQYVFEARVDGNLLKEWLRSEWMRTGLPLREANKACGVADAAVRKYLDQGHLWYFPPPEKFEHLSKYANKHGQPAGKPYFSFNGTQPGTAKDWESMRSKFNCPHGVTNVWNRRPLRGNERVTTETGRAVHLNQKPLDLMTRIIEATSDPGDVVWEPFGGLFSGALAARILERRAFASEIDGTYYQYGIRRFNELDHQLPLF